MPTIFISHASEDKDGFVRPLAEALLRKFDVWYDEYELKIGDSLRGKIDEGLHKADYGVVVLSPSFFRKKWTAAELDGLLALETSTRKLILPVWHGLTLSEVMAQSPILAGRLAADGARGIQVVADLLEQAITASERTREVVATNPGRDALRALSSSIASDEYERKRLNSREGVRDVEAAGALIVEKMMADFQAVNQDGSIQRFVVQPVRIPQTATILGPFGIGIYLDYHNQVGNSARDADFSAKIFRLTEDMKWNNTPAVELRELKFLPRLCENQSVSWVESKEANPLSGDEVVGKILGSFSRCVEQHKPQVR
jgi:hypothetical protein